MNEVAFGNRLRTVRKERKLTTNALSDACGITAVFLRQIESAQRLPSLPVFALLCNELRVSPYYLLMDSLDTSDDERLDCLMAKMKALTPKQLDIVTSMLDTLVEKMDE